MLQELFKIANTYNDTILAIVKKAKQEGKSKIILYGNSYIKFLIVYACQEIGVDFFNVDADSPIDMSALCLVGELNELDLQNQLIHAGCVSLLEIVQER